ncbi:NitT/TauT family transport system permease protein [Bauldia litoralis]|uniref:NitT/TauT family transport system permease protein n=2 Tax=Bauldia litoralis TaxID=665467 RepID=A0A1G6B2U1_9HYPH|nr:NitT/TauT family transport system permease protein [Bauldia litoralis]
MRGGRPDTLMAVTHGKLTRSTRLSLGAIPFVLLIAAYAVGSHLRRLENPADKLLPPFGKMADAFWEMATVPDKRSGDLLLWSDTALSLGRLGVGIAVAALIAVSLGVLIGFVPRVRASLAPFVAAISLIPPITILPILFIIFGLGELSKVMLIVLGTAPIMTRSLAQAVIDIPREQIIKAETLGAGPWQLVQRVVLPQIWPKLVTAMRLGLVPAWIFLISAEAIASTGGLGYRIFLVRRYLAMDIIIPYVLWITLLAYTLDRLLHAFSRRAFRWAHLEGDSL